MWRDAPGDESLVKGRECEKHAVDDIRQKAYG